MKQEPVFPEGNFWPINDDDPEEIDCLVIGGFADGQILRVQFHAAILELGEAAGLNGGHPMPAKTSTYNVCRTHWPLITGQFYPMALAVVDGKSLGWAAKELTSAYANFSRLEQKETT